MKEPHSFRHEAMHTPFVLRLLTGRARRAEQTAFECFRRLDELESNLSRFLEDSDIARINELETGQSLMVSEDTDACMRLAMEMHEQTEGLFDITLGKQIAHRKDHNGSQPPEIKGQLALDPDKPAVHCIEAGREIDLGGIGKGFALDKLRSLCEEWDIPAGLLSAGESTHLSFGDHPWPIKLNGEHIHRTIQLQQAALSISGIDTQGCHIVSPRQQSATYSYRRIWVIDATATTADAWSTAALLMQPDEIRAHSNRVQIIVDE